MNGAFWLQVGLYLLVLLALAYPLARYMTALFDGSLSARFAWLGKCEQLLLRVLGSDAAQGMRWWQYAQGLLLFNLLGVLAVYLLQRAQALLPLNPQNMAAVSPDSAFNTAVSFVTNTNWQGYGGESTMSYLTQMLALTVQNFTSAATGIAVALVLIRGFARRAAQDVGNFWLDLWRSTLGLLLPLSVLFALLLVGQGVVQTFAPYQEVQLLEPLSYQSAKTGADGKPVLDAAGKPVLETVQTRSQTLALGPVASQEAIKMLGTNGGGFFNANSAHPFENPTPLSNWMQMLSIFLLPAALCFVFGRMVGNPRQGWVLIGAMTLLFVAGCALNWQAENQLNPKLAPLVADAASNLEGKETRFGVVASTLFATITTAASCGAVNAMHDSLMPLSGMGTMLLMQLGEVVFGGVGSGLYGMLVFAVLTVFLSGLMIGRTPEYLGKKIEAYEMKMVSIAILITPLLVLLGTAVAATSGDGLAGLANPGPHGFSELLYAFSSAANNNGSAFAGLSANTPFYNLLLAVAMWFGRFAVIIPVLAIGGRLAAKPKLAVSAGTLPPDDVHRFGFTTPSGTRKTLSAATSKPA